MPWSTPNLKTVRSIVRDDIRSSLPGADASVPNSVLRVMSDAQGALCHLTLQYVDWLAAQLLPDSAEMEWLDRHADIWLVNADGSTGRKMATYAVGTASFTGEQGAVVPAATKLEANPAGLPTLIGYETIEDIRLLGFEPTTARIRALDAGAQGNLQPDTSLSISPTILNVDTTATVLELTGGVDTEGDEVLRIRVLERIREPPHGGAQHDYVRWAKAVPGVTRAWCAPNEMGIGTVTVRFMMDVLRADRGGFPIGSDIAIVEAYLDTVRPVAVKDLFVVGPIPQPIDIFVDELVPDTESMRAAITQNVNDMLLLRASPGTTIFAAWKYHAIMETPGVESFRLTVNADDVMPSPGHMAVLGDISFV